jgi:hypothetical protein
MQGPFRICNCSCLAHELRSEPLSLSVCRKHTVKGNCLLGSYRMAWTKVGELLTWKEAGGSTFNVQVPQESKQRKSVVHQTLAVGNLWWDSGAYPPFCRRLCCLIASPFPALCSCHHHPPSVWPSLSPPSPAHWHCFPPLALLPYPPVCHAAPSSLSRRCLLSVTATILACQYVTSFCFTSHTDVSFHYFPSSFTFISLRLFARFHSQHIKGRWCHGCPGFTDLSA